ncbi:penicillin-binding protein activator [Vibrio sp. ZSDE26]|uniref:Penicillin-binding protein activator LpoA n=1 Tax=Vibrio amylolyticus TaxID=2847292 RepID=A0A9X1XK87_9VIBR|nr:penicillin-binding protein activator [Vibrio amylolyticus]MCK6264807.1 penicillin-binding protein activator [Vibrio amylolyticus]
MKNHKRISVPRLLTPVALAVVLSACSSKPSAPTYVDILLDPVQSAQNYLMQADSAQGSIQNDWLIMAFKAAIESNDVDLANRLSKRIVKQKLSALQQSEWQLSRAELLNSQGEYQQALNQLNFQAQWSLPDQQWIDYYQLRADLYANQSRFFESSKELVHLSAYQDEMQQRETANLIWDNLGRYPSNQVDLLSSAADESTIDGWVQLSVYMKTLSGDIPMLKSSLSNWLEENPYHPASLYTPQAIQDILDLEISKPNSTAILLPLSGRFAKQAQLIRDGFIMAMMNDEEREEDATLTIIDTNKTSKEELESILIEKNIDFIVGPLTKDNVEELEEIQDTFEYHIPTLALNIPEQLEVGTGTCYLALSPEQEVAQAAHYLHKQGYQYPLVLAPQGRLGERVSEAFSSEWETLSDNKVSVSLFGDKRQLQRNINSVFGLQQSQQHIAQIEALMGIPLESQPRSRRDIDAVYIVAKGSELTLIKPFIEVAINPDTKPPQLFSNSRSNSGNKQYEDLTGITYSDIPLLLQNDSSLTAQMEQLWPRDSNSERRLQALGIDAYHMMDQLPQMKLLPEHSYQGQTGLLRIDENCIVQREISWSEYGAL